MNAVPLLPGKLVLRILHKKRPLSCIRDNFLHKFDLTTFISMNAVSPSVNGYIEVYIKNATLS